MPACRARAFASLLAQLRGYTDEHGETLRTIFRRALYLDIHRRFVRLPWHDTDDGPGWAVSPLRTRSSDSFDEVGR